MVSQAQAEAIAKDAGLSPGATDDLVSLYNESQIAALKKALLIASLFVLVGAWCAKRLPDKPLQAVPVPEAAAVG